MQFPQRRMLYSGQPSAQKAPFPPGPQGQSETIPELEGSCSEVILGEEEGTAGKKARTRSPQGCWKPCTYQQHTGNGTAGKRPQRPRDSRCGKKSRPQARKIQAKAEAAHPWKSMLSEWNQRHAHRCPGNVLHSEAPHLWQVSHPKRLIAEKGHTLSKRAKVSFASPDADR